MSNKKLKIKKKKNITIGLTILGLVTSASIGIALPIANNLKKKEQIKVSKNNLFKDKNNFNNFNQKIATKQESLPDGKISPSQLSALSNHAKMPQAVKGIKRDFRIKTNRENGVATITISFSNNHGHKETASYQIANFKTNLDMANEKIKKIKIEDIENNPLKKENVFIEYNSVPNENQIKHPTHNKFTFKFLRATAVDANGNSQATYQVDVTPQVTGTNSKELTFDVGGFQTKLAAAQDKINTLLSSNVNGPTKKQQVAYRSTPTISDLNPPQARGFDFKFLRATAVDANGNSQATYQVDVTPQVTGTNSKELTFKVSGFQTQVTYANIRIHNLLLKSSFSNPTKKQQVTYRHIPSADDLNPPKDNANIFNFEFLSATAVDESGKSEVKYFAKLRFKDGYVAKRIYIFKIENFQTKKEYFDYLVKTIKDSTSRVVGGPIVDPELANSTPEQIIKKIKDTKSFKRYTKRNWFDIIEDPNDIEIEVIKIEDKKILRRLKAMVQVNIKIKERPNEIFKYKIYWI